ncbi:right-handed parallel beta-helix repeat-containing protein [Flavobacteriaceae bacterium XHP0103]|uniref:right-handed parallel beta-helix repeat-containing protein n=1 Tax=Marixanthotalea marina TaxID=2844359 RepID=UPI002989FCCB|nr:right-handed parallel beta-helix repeat-containing protein [Marixanthotalea marina]MBU3822290.1 right-handed parallel beta-helix repeat-containing protein [Marixanthotalea marina]
MKSLVKPMLTIFLFLTFFSSCNNEELFIEPIIEVVEEPTTPDDDITTEEDEVLEEEENTEDVDDTPVEASTTPCDFNLSTVQSGATVVINCVMDLDGQTINLPSNVTIAYEGGDIKNGTLNFSGGSVISGELLNNTLELTGTLPTLKENEFDFIPNRWGIVEGKVSDEVASTNSDIINQTIDLVKELGVDTFLIDKLDAYFGMQDLGQSKYASVFIPSDFSFIMTENTNLRVQPNDLEKHALLFSWNADNVLISGGKLWGDRYTHDYSGGGSHEWGHIISFKGVHNGIVDNVEMHDGAGDGFYVWPDTDRNADGTLKPGRRESFNITVKNSLINNNRRNNISIVDGTNIFIEYNTITNGGSANSVSPAVAVIVESRATMAPDGNSLYTWEKTENVHIRHNIFEDNRADVVLLSGEKTYIYGNTFRSKSGVGIAAAADGKVYNNTFENTERLASNSKALVLESRAFSNGEYRVKNYEVTNNTFTGYQYGILANGAGHEIKDNTIINCERSITVGSSKDLEFYNNTITSNVSKSYGYYTFQTESSIKNCLITNGEINVQDKALFFTRKNNIEAGNIIIDNVDFKGDIKLNGVQNITIKNSTYDNIEIIDCSPTLINNN